MLPLPRSAAHPQEEADRGREQAPVEDEVDLREGERDALAERGVAALKSPLCRIHDADVEEGRDEREAEIGDEEEGVRGDAPYRLPLLDKREDDGGEEQRNEEEDGEYAGEDGEEQQLLVLLHDVQCQLCYLPAP